MNARTHATADANGPQAPSLSEPVRSGDGNTAFEYELLSALQGMRSGDFSVRMVGEQTGIRGKITDLLNDIAAANQRMAQQLEGVGESVAISPHRQRGTTVQDDRDWNRHHQFQLPPQSRRRPERVPSE